MKVKFSTYLAKWLVDHGITINFTVPGGGAMHLNNSFAAEPGLKNVFVQHEQAASIAAEGYYRECNRLPLVCVTTGPGGTNAITGVLGAWLDSIPMLVISGQVKWSTTVASTGYPMRIFGDQEYDITKPMAHMTKYAMMLTVPEMALYHVEKAIYLATHGRPGPVWLDMPHNIQAAMIDPDELIHFNPEELANTNPGPVSDQVIDLLIEKIKAAKRPVLYSGIEVRTSGDYEAFRQLVERLNIPVVTSFDGVDMLEDSHPLHAGRAGDVATRYGNWAVQNSDFLLVLGSRLGIRQVSYATKTWAREAFVAMVYPDSLELTKPNVHVELPIRATYQDFLAKMLKKVQQPMAQRQEWLDIIAKWKEDYPLVSDQQKAQKEPANIYAFFEAFSKLLPENTTTVASNGSCEAVGGAAYQMKKGGRFIINSGAASMGYGLPAAIGAAFANGKEVICLEGDGSIQMNLQELQTMVFHQLPIKIVLINNEGYHSMRQTHANLFKDYPANGIGPESQDLSFPNMEKIASAYGIPYFKVTKNEETESVSKAFLAHKSYALMEVFVDKDQFFFPKPSAMRLPDGTLISPPLEDMAPFLPREELEKIMIIPLVDNQKK